MAPPVRLSLSPSATSPVRREQTVHLRRRILRCVVAAETLSHLGIAVKHTLTSLTAGKDERQLARNVTGAERVGYKFRHDIRIGYEIDKRYVSHMNELSAEP